MTFSFEPVLLMALCGPQYAERRIWIKGKRKKESRLMSKENLWATDHTIRHLLAWCFSRKHSGQKKQICIRWISTPITKLSPPWQRIQHSQPPRHMLQVVPLGCRVILKIQGQLLLQGHCVLSSDVARLPVYRNVHVVEPVTQSQWFSYSHWGNIRVRRKKRL